MCTQSKAATHAGSQKIPIIILIVLGISIGIPIIYRPVGIFANCQEYKTTTYYKLSSHSRTANIQGAITLTKPLFISHKHKKQLSY